MKMTLCRYATAALVTACAAGTAAATPLTLGSGPNTAIVAGTGSSLNGVTVFDGAGGAYLQPFSAPGGFTLDKIVWWGYRGDDPTAGTAADVFEVLVNGVLRTGSLSTAAEGVLTKYTLDIADTALAAGAGTLSLFNNESDFEWFWQGTTNVAWDGVSTTFPVAFNLVGDVATSGVPEPGSLALVALAGMALLASRHTRRTR